MKWGRLGRGQDVVQVAFLLALGASIKSSHCRGFEAFVDVLESFFWYFPQLFGNFGIQRSSSSSAFPCTLAHKARLLSPPHHHMLLFLTSFLAPIPPNSTS